MALFSVSSLTPAFGVFNQKENVLIAAQEATEVPQSSTSLKRQLEALKSRLEAMEGKISELTKIRTEYNKKHKGTTAKSIKAHIDRAQKLMDEADAIAVDYFNRLKKCPIYPPA